MRDPPTVLSQMDRPSNRPIRRGCFPIVGGFHQVEKLPWNHRVVDHGVGSAQRVHCERGEMAGVAVARSHEPHRPVSKLGQF
jgi:hypothetical protein